MRFSKEKFLKTAPAGIKRQLKDYVDTLDGIEVVFEGEYGQIPAYFAGVLSELWRMSNEKNSRVTDRPKRHSHG